MKHLLLVVSLMFAIHGVAQTSPASPSEQLFSMNADEYRAMVMDEQKIDAQLDLLKTDESELSDVFQRILSARKSHPEVFRQLPLAVEHARKTIPTSLFRPGLFRGALRIFCLLGPVPYCGFQYKMNDDGSFVHVKVQDPPGFTAEELKQGADRNEAAKMAVLELLAKGLDGETGYEQSEILSACNSLFSLSIFNKTVKFSNAIFQDIVIRRTDTHPIVILYSCRSDSLTREQKRVLCKAMLVDSETPSKLYYDRYVQESLEYLKKEFPEDLLEIETNQRWKYAMIQRLLGHPLPPEDEINAKDIVPHEITISEIMNP